MNDAHCTIHNPKTGNTLAVVLKLRDAKAKRFLKVYPTVEGKESLNMRVHELHADMLKLLGNHIIHFQHNLPSIRHRGPVPDEYHLSHYKQEEQYKI